MGDNALAIIIGSKPIPRSNDTEFPFRQDSDFWYLTGFDHPNAIAVLRTDGGPEYTLFVEPRDPEMEIWNGYRPGVEGAREDYGADEAHACETFVEQLPGLVRKARTLYHVLGRDTQVDATITRTLEELRVRSRQGIEPAESIVDRMNEGHPYKSLTIHRYFPPDGLDGALGFLDVRRERFERLIDEGFENTVSHDCEANQCVLAGEHRQLAGER